jgi:hemerythrin
MVPVIWNRQLSVEVQEFDEQHEQLIGSINELHQGLETGSGKEAQAKAFREIVAKTSAHFRAEEKLLRSHGYPALADQRQSHALFEKEVKNLFSQFKRGGLVATSLLSFLKRLEHHIQGDDRECARFLNHKGVY